MEKPLLKTILLKGESGDSIESLTKVSQVGAVATYRITLTSGSTFDFEVTNGTNIATIEKTDTSGLVDTYTITLTDGSTSTFQVTNGQDGEVTNIDTELDTSSNRPIANSAVATAISGVNGDISDIQGDISDIQGDISDIQTALGFLSDTVKTDYVTPVTVSGNPILSGEVTQDMTALPAGTYLVFYRFHIFDITLSSGHVTQSRLKLGGTATSGDTNTTAGIRQLSTQYFEVLASDTIDYTTAVLLDVSESVTPQMQINFVDPTTWQTNITYKANVYMTAIKIR